jgi:hypothetical protein
VELFFSSQLSLMDLLAASDWCDVPGLLPPPLLPPAKSPPRFPGLSPPTIAGVFAPRVPPRPPPPGPISPRTPLPCPVSSPTVSAASPEEPPQAIFFSNPHNISRRPYARL